MIINVHKYINIIQSKFIEYNWKKKSTDRRLAIINLFQMATDKSNQLLLIDVTLW